MYPQLTFQGSYVKDSYIETILTKGTIIEGHTLCQSKSVFGVVVVYYYISNIFLVYIKIFGDDMHIFTT